MKLQRLSRLPLIAALSASLLAATPFATLAADYPIKPIRLLIGFAPGGLTDINGRVFAAALQKKFGQPVVVENRAGASGAIAREQVSKAAPDGYTLLTEPTTLLGYAAFTKNPSMDVQKELTSITVLTEGTFVLVAAGNTPFKSFQEMVAYGKANPGKMNYGSNGPGVVTLSLEAIKSQYGISMVGIDYKSSADSYRALLSNDVQLTLTSVGRAVTDTASGRIKSLAVTGGKRDSAMPTVPTASELGFERLFASWQALFGPAGLPPAVVRTIYEAALDVGKTKEVADALAKMEQDVVTSTPEATAQRIDREIKAWREIVKVAGIKLE